MKRQTLAALGALLLAGCTSLPPDSPELSQIKTWEKSLRMKLDWVGPREHTLENACLEVSADPLPRLGTDVHFHGQTFVEVDGYLVFMGDISDNHSNVQNCGVMDWYRRIRSGTIQIHYRHTFYRSFSDGPNWQDKLKDMQVLHSGVRTITLKKG